VVNASLIYKGQSQAILSLFTGFTFTTKNCHPNQPEHNA